MILKYKLSSFFILVFALVMLLSSCNSGKGQDDMPTKKPDLLQSEQSTPSDTLPLDEVSEQPSQDGEADNSSGTQSQTPADKTVSSPKDETAPNKTQASTVKQTQETSGGKATTTTKAANTEKPGTYKEWSYESVATGDLITYTENPNDPHILAASKKLKIEPQRLSATKNKKGATIFIFSSRDKSEKTLTDMRVMYSDKTIEDDMWQEGKEGNNKILARALYKNAMSKQPR